MVGNRRLERRELSPIFHASSPLRGKLILKKKKPQKTEPKKAAKEEDIKKIPGSTNELFGDLRSEQGVFVESRFR